MKYLVALMILIGGTTIVEAGPWRSGDTGTFRFMCKEIQDVAGLLKVKNRAEGFSYLMRMNNEGKCAFVMNGGFNAKLVDKLIEAEMFDGPTQIFSATVNATDGTLIHGFVIVNKDTGTDDNI